MAECRSSLTACLYDIVTQSIIATSFTLCTADTLYSLTPEGGAYRREVINPVTNVLGFEGAGYGRIVRFEKAQKLGKILDHVTYRLGSLKALSLALPQSVVSGSKLDMPISSIGICAGSGGSTLRGLDVDMLFTGELTHHDALAAIEQGRVVVTTFHSNTERSFLADVLRTALRGSVEQVLSATPQDQMKVMENFDVYVSCVDRDPFETVIRQSAVESLLHIK
jgi:putative NIF3 family GTP cyclohydrolase 1 type 2